MQETRTTIHRLDAAYKAFPPFAEWAAKTSIDATRWDRYKAQIEESKASDGARRRAREIVKRAAALDTGALEGLYDVDRGFTFSVAMEAAGWETDLARRGENVRPLFEAQLEAYDFVLDLATKSEPVSEMAIRKLHEIVCRAQDTYFVETAVGPQQQKLEKGRYKVNSNHVRTRDGVNHSYAPVDMTPAEMQRLVRELRTEEFQAAHPVIQAAYAHYAFVVIHPFADGNGRVARALASIFTYRAISMPIMILSEQKGAYLDALEAADGGLHQEFIEFMHLRSLDTMTVVLDAFRSASRVRGEDSANAIKSLYITKGGYSQMQVDEAGMRLFQSIFNEIGKELLEKADLTIQTNVQKAIFRDRNSSPSGSHRHFGDDDLAHTYLVVELQSAYPFRKRVVRHFQVWVPKDALNDDDLQVARILPHEQNILGLSHEGVVEFETRMDSLMPDASVVLQMRAEIFAKRVVGEMLEDLSKVLDVFRPRLP